MSSSFCSLARLASFPDSQEGGVLFKVFLVVFLEGILVSPMMFYSSVEQWESGNFHAGNVWTDHWLCV